MPKAMLILIVLFVAGLGFLLYRGGKRLLGETPPATVEEKKPGSPVRGGTAGKEAGSAAQALLDQATHKARKIAADTSAALRGPVIRLSLDETPIMVEAGTPKEVKIRRSNDEKMEALQLRLAPAADSKLTVKGGAFAKGASETTFIVEASAAGLDASLTIEAGPDLRMVVPVRVK